MKKFIYMLEWMMLLLISFSISSELKNLPKNLIGDIWNTDSVFIGADVEVLDSTKDVIVTLISQKGINTTGDLYFVKNDPMISVKLHQIERNASTNNSTQINIGRFPKDSKLYFMYICNDTSMLFSKFCNKKIYTGQNRDNIDPFVSNSTNGYGNKWAAVGNISMDTVLVGFSDLYLPLFSNLLFKVSNAKVTK